MSTIHKSSNINDTPSYDKEYWWAKTPQERLTAALKLIRRAKAIYYSNPANPPLGNVGQILKSDKPIQRGKRKLLGAHAVIAHGYLRMTGDIDIFVQPSDENADRSQPGKPTRFPKLTVNHFPQAELPVHVRLTNSSEYILQPSPVFRHIDKYVPVIN